MNSDLAIQTEGVSKKFCKSLRRSMAYGMKDIGRNLMGLSSHSNVLRNDEFWALHDITFDVKRGETLGIVGPNGSGKTTLLKLLNGIFWPDKGKLSLRGRVGSLIEVGAGFHPLLSGKENIYVNAAILGMTGSEVNAKMDSIVEFAGIGDFLNVPVKYYSSGMFVRLGFSIAIHCEPDILLIDEILAVGDIAFQNKCLNKISGIVEEGGRSIVIVSHDMNAISLLCDRCLLLHKGELVLNDRPDIVTEKFSSIFVNEKETAFSDLLRISFVNDKGEKVIDLHCESTYELIIDMIDITIEKGLFIAFSFINYENKFSYRMQTDVFKNIKGHLHGKKLVVHFDRFGIPKGYYTIRLAISDGSYINRRYHFEETIYFKVMDSVDSPKFLQAEWSLID
ncbi:MAG: ABC transporter ATP-binding protein [Syntrophorhabdaceae bacterium]|nr:ABC transporter ATP-binding protein [Syntrophorhabdaceae bacterium]